MTSITQDQAIENIYASLNNDNEDIDLHIQALKTTFTDGQKATITINPERLVHNNRTGRKMLQSYFRKKGIIVGFGS